MKIENKIIIDDYLLTLYKTPKTFVEHKARNSTLVVGRLGLPVTNNLKWFFKVDKKICISEFQSNCENSNFHCEINKTMPSHTFLNVVSHGGPHFRIQLSDDLFANSTFSQPSK